MNPITSNPSRPFIKTAELARMLGVDRSTIFQWVQKGKLKPEKTPGRNFRFRREEVEKLFGNGSDKQFEEKRKEPRFEINCQGLVKAGDDVYFATIKDFSMSGMGLVVRSLNGFSESLKQGSIKTLSVSPQKNHVFKDWIMGEVRHWRQLDDGHAVVGLALKAS